jgi:nuclear pore complex protein Nup98-Nup96
LPALLGYLSGRKISEACSLAQKSGDHRLALLLSLSEGTHIVRQLIENQLIGWSELGVSSFGNTEQNFEEK